MKRKLPLLGLLLLVGCENTAIGRELSVEAGTKKSTSEVLEEYFTRAEKADAITDAEKRCLVYPDIPDVSWGRDVTRARCALQRSPLFSLDQVRKLVSTEKGRRNLNAKYTDLLNVHYSAPGKRDQIFVSTKVFEDAKASSEIVDAWVGLEPDGAYSNLAAGLQRLAAASNVRGEASAVDTPEADMETMGSLVDEAEIFLEKALRSEPRLSPACVALAKARRMAKGSYSAKSTGRKCLASDPLSYFVVMEWKQDNEPRWGGDEEGLEEVLSHIRENSDANSLLSTIVTSVKADPYLGLPQEALPNVLDDLKSAIKNGPNSLVLNYISAAYYESGDYEKSLTYLSQAIRFNVDDTNYRSIRAQRNMVLRPSWSILDYEILLDGSPDSSFYRNQIEIAKSFLERKNAGVVYEPDQEIAVDDSVLKTLILSQCEEFVLAGKSDPVMMECPDQIVNDWPDDPEAWRVRAEILHFLNNSEALHAAKKYLEIADKNAPRYRANKERFESWLSQEK